MKLLICLAALLVVANAIDPEFKQQIRQKMRSQIEECAKEVSASPDDVTAIFSHKIPGNRAGQCIFFCMHKIYGAQNEDGSLNMPAALANLDILKDMDLDLYNKLYKTFKNCESTPSDSDPCVFATRLVECIVIEGKANGLEEAVIE